MVKVRVMSAKQGGSEETPKYDEDDDDTNEQWWAYDDITGAAIAAEKVKEARQEEIGYIRKHEVYQKVKRSSVPVGEKIIKVRWIDINKGDEVQPDIRSRLVAKDYKSEDRPELFAGTLPDRGHKNHLQ